MHEKMVTPPPSKKTLLSKSPYPELFCNRPDQLPALALALAGQLEPEHILDSPDTEIHIKITARKRRKKIAGEQRKREKPMTRWLRFPALPHTHSYILCKPPRPRKGDSQIFDMMAMSSARAGYSGWYTNSVGKLGGGGYFRIGEYGVITKTIIKDKSRPPFHAGC